MLTETEDREICATEAYDELFISLAQFVQSVELNTINTMQYNTMQYNTMQYNTMQYNTMQYNTIQCNTIQYSAIQYNTIQNSTKTITIIVALPRRVSRPQGSCMKTHSFRRKMPSEPHEDIVLH